MDQKEGSIYCDVRAVLCSCNVFISRVNQVCSKNLYFKIILFTLLWRQTKPHQIPPPKHLHFKIHSQNLLMGNIFKKNIYILKFTHTTCYWGIFSKKVCNLRNFWEKMILWISTIFPSMSTVLKLFWKSFFAASHKIFFINVAHWL